MKKDKNIYDLAYEYYTKGDYAGALSAYYQILAEDLSNSSSYYNIGYIYDMLLEYELAVSYYKKALKMNPNDIRSANNIAKIFVEVENNEEAARQYLDWAIQVAPTDAEAYNEYGNIYFNKKDYKTSKIYLQKAINYDNAYYKNYYDIAKAYIGLDDFESAKESLKKCIQLNPDYDLAKELLSKLD